MSQAQALALAAATIFFRLQPRTVAAAALAILASRGR